MYVIQETLNACFTTGGALAMPTWTPQANETLLLAVVTNQPVLAVTAVAGNGLVWTLVADLNNARGAMGIVLYRASSVSAPTPGPVTFTTVSSKPVKAVLTRISGVDVTVDNGVEAVGVSPGAPTDNTNLKVDVASLEAGAKILTFAGHSQMSGEIIALPAGQSMVFQDSVDCGTGYDRLRAHFWEKDDPLSPAGLYTMGQDGSLIANAPWAAIAVALTPSDAEPPPDPPGPVVPEPEFLAVNPEGRIHGIFLDGNQVAKLMFEGSTLNFFLLDPAESTLHQCFLQPVLFAIGELSFAEVEADGNVIGEHLFRG